MIHIESYTIVELESILHSLEKLESDKERMLQMSREYFSEFDADKSGALDKEELTNLTKQFFDKQNCQIPFDKNFIDAWFVDLDVDQSGKIDLNELVEMMEAFNSMLIRMYKAAVEAKKNKK